MPNRRERRPRAIRKRRPNVGRYAGWEGVTAEQASRLGAGKAQPAKPSKYRNVKVIVDGFQFDSKREAMYWVGLKARAEAGEIQGLERQVHFPLYAPDERRGVTAKIQVAEYIADYVYYIGFEKHVVDAKARRVCPYPLKKKWLELQDGIIIEEV